MAGVVFLSARNDASARYRCLHAAEQLFLRGIPAAVFPAARLGDARRALTAGGLLVLHRIPLGPPVERLIAEAERVGAVPVFDCDDDIFRAPPDLEGRGTSLRRLRRALFADEIRRYRSAARRCRALIVSTERLAGAAKRLGRPGWIHRNAYSARLLEISDAAPARPPRDAVVLGYASGTPTHDRDFLQAKPALVRILNDHPRAEFWAVGPVDVGGGWGRSESRVRRFPAVPWRSLPDVLAGFDVNLAPLDVASPVSAAKSEVKYIEAALVGVPTLASPTGAFALAIRPGENGLLAGSEEEWRAGLERLVSDPAFRARLGEGARRDVRDRYSPEAAARDLLRVLDDILALAGHAPLKPSAPAVAPPPDVPRAGLARRAWFTARNRGLGILWRQGLVRLLSALLASSGRAQ